MGQRVHPGPHGGPDFETAVLASFRRTLVDYCRGATTTADPRAGRPGPQIRITVVTAAPLDRVRDQIRVLAEQTVRVSLPGAQLVGVAFLLDPRTAPPGHRVAIDPPLPAPSGLAAPTRPLPTQPLPAQPFPAQPFPADPAGEPTWPFPPGPPNRDGYTWTLPFAGRPPAGAPGGRPDTLVLTLSYGDRLHWTYRLLPAQVWVPIGRGLVASGAHSTVRLPDFLTAVPRGPLLLIQYWSSAAVLCRSRHRPEYTVSVDGRRLPPDSQVPAAAAGTIDYTRGHGPDTVLTYQLSMAD